LVLRGEKRNTYRVSVEDLKKRDHLEDLSVDENNIKVDVKEIAWDGVVYIKRKK
jgi:hypothetical protein